MLGGLLKFVLLTGALAARRRHVRHRRDRQRTGSQRRGATASASTRARDGRRYEGGRPNSGSAGRERESAKVVGRLLPKRRSRIHGCQHDLDEPSFKRSSRMTSDTSILE
jgi:hypothetical protein